jgi:hypothetical protein
MLSAADAAPAQNRLLYDFRPAVAACTALHNIKQEQVQHANSHILCSSVAQGTSSGENALKKVDKIQIGHLLRHQPDQISANDST